MSQTPSQPGKTHSKIRSLLLVLLLLSILVVVNLLYGPAMAYRSPLSAPPGDVLYAAGFDGFEDEWEQYEGRLEARISDGVMRLRVENTTSTAYSAAAPVFEDFDARVTLTAVDGPIDNGMGIVFRLQTPTSDCDMPLKILCDLSAIDIIGVPLRLIFRPQPQPVGYYMFLISSDGYYSVWRGGDEGSRRISTWIASDAINQGLGAANTIRVVGRENRFQFFINGQDVALCIPDNPEDESTFFAGECVGGQMTNVLEDDSFPYGQIGVAAHTTQTGGPGVIIEFDNVIVISPAAASEDTGPRA